MTSRASALAFPHASTGKPNRDVIIGVNTPLSNLWKAKYHQHMGMLVAGINYPTRLSWLWRIGPEAV
jgi:hypothetical protein